MGEKRAEAFKSSSVRCLACFWITVPILEGKACSHYIAVTAEQDFLGVSHTLHKLLKLVLLSVLSCTRVENGKFKPRK